MNSRLENDALRSHLFRRITWEDLDGEYLRRLISMARAEDLEGAGLAVPPTVPGDATTAQLDPAMHGRAALVARRAMTVCGLPLAPLILESYGLGCVFTSVVPAEAKTAGAKTVADGDALAAGAVLGYVSGPVGVLLQAERVLLNFLQRLSGVATLTAAYTAALGESPTRLLDTRKTTPGFRALEKYAVACGGGWNHRLGLFDRIMLKDNHLAASGAGAGDALTVAARRAREARPDLVIEVEVDRLDQIPPLLAAEVDVILLDNFSPQALAKAVSLTRGRALTEASGGITLDTLPALASLGLDFISTGALVHQSVWMDIGLDWIDAAN